MGRGKPLTSEERGKIEAYFEQKLSFRKIGEKIGRSARVVFNYIKNQNSYGKNMKGRPASILTPTDKRAILRIASNSSDSIPKIKVKAGVSASISTVRRLIVDAPHIQRMKLKKKPVLKPIHKEKRLDFAKVHMTWNTEWHTVVFSDEKKFNLDGPDGYNFYYHDMRKEEVILSRRHSRIGGIMVWGAISYYGQIKLQFKTTKLNAEHYKNILERAFPECSNIFRPLRWIFQQDNAPIHNARVVKAWISDQNVTLMDWPPYSPDLNIVENVWGWLSLKVYEGGKQYEDVPLLINAIETAWDEISLDYLKTLYDSIPNRIFEVIKHHGGNTHY